MEEVKIYYKRDGREFLILNLRSGKVFRLFDNVIEGREDFSLVFDLPRPNDRYFSCNRQVLKYDRLESLWDFWGFEFLYHIFVVSYFCDFSCEAPRDWGEYVCVNHAVWPYLINILMMHQFFLNFDSVIVRLKIISPLENYRLMVDILRDYDSELYEGIGKMLKGYGEAMGW
jgi:hypothetical protein